jgi:hypothetical protein
MTPEQYTNWKKTRSKDPADWNRDLCYAADALIRKTALEVFEVRIKKLPIALRSFLRSTAYAHFGSVEVNTMLTKLKCYPDWM